MQKTKNFQSEVDGDGDRDGNERSPGKVPSGNRNTNGIGSESGSNNGQKNIKSNSSGNRQRGGTDESQSCLNLGAFTQAANDTVQHMAETHEAIKHLSELYIKHTRDIEEIPKIQQRSKDLESLCKEKDERIKMHRHTISTLKEMSREKEQEFAEEKAKIQKERDELDAEKMKFDKYKENAEKRIKAQEAEQRNRQEKELQKLKAEQDRECDNHKDRLEQDLKKQKDQIKKRLTDLEAAKKTLSEELEERKQTIKELEVMLRDSQDKYDDLTRVKNSFKEEKQKLEVRLRMIEDEFALNGQTTEF
jgi:chromosome segregation ATPase